MESGLKHSKSKLEGASQNIKELEEQVEYLSSKASKYDSSGMADLQK